MSPLTQPACRCTVLVLAALLILGLAGCTDAGVYAASEDPYLANKLTLSGDLCTDDPTALGFPVRVLLLVDDYEMLDRLDPQGHRADAVLRLLSRWSGQPNYSFAVVRFAGSARNLVSDFSQDPAALSAAAEQLRMTSPCSEAGCRDFMGGLSLASSLVTGDVLATQRGPRARTRYVIVTFLGGLPNPLLSQEECPGSSLWECTLAELQRRVQTLREFVLDQGAAGLQLHAALLADPDADNIAASTTVEGLASTGHGSALVFQEPEAIDFDELDLSSAETVFLKKSLVVANTNARVLDGEVVPDSDADGLADLEEIRIGTRPDARDTDRDGLSDGIELLLGAGYDPLRPDQPPVCGGVDPFLDWDGDGLGDCEEKLLGTDATVFDTDADGYPDGLEINLGTNPLHDDRLEDVDLDGEANGAELRSHTDPRADDREARWSLAYRYAEDAFGVRSVPFCAQPRQTTGVSVTGASLLSTAGVGTLSFQPGAPPTLSWTDPDPYSLLAGEPVELTRDGSFVLPGADARRSLSVEVVRALLPVQPVREALVVGASQRDCFAFQVRNITLVETLAAADGSSVRGENRVRVFVSQVPADAPQTSGLFRVAEIGVRYLEPDLRTPDLEEFVVDERDFVLYGD